MLSLDALALAADSSFWARLTAIVMVDLLLAGDNAIVIAMAVRILPPREQFFGRIWGTVGAVALRLLFIACVTWLLAIPLLKAAGGVLLFWVAWKLLSPKSHGIVPAPAGDGTATVDHAVKAGRNLREAIWVIIVADVSMSLDNVLAVAGTAHGDLLLVAIGIALTIPLVVFGSAILGRLMERWPAIVWLGGGVLGYVAGTLIVGDDRIHAWFGKPANEALHPLPIAAALVFTVFGWWNARPSAGVPA